MEKLQVGRCGRPRKEVRKAVLLPAWRVAEKASALDLQQTPVGQVRPQRDSYHLVQFRRLRWALPSEELWVWRRRHL